MERQPLIGKTFTELKQVVQALQLPAFTANQLSEWLYKRQVRDFDEMTNISLKNRELLSRHYCVGIYPPEKTTISKDGTKKYLFASPNFSKGEEHSPLLEKGVGGEVETVYIPDDDRHTLCVSVQAGCKMNCLFCATGKLGFERQLSAHEIINQIVAVPEAKLLTNIVFMGMGEPMDNLTETLAVLEILTEDYGFAWSPKRITVSTIGLLPAMTQFIEKSKCHLAVSMHTPFSNERLKLMPVEKACSLEAVLAELRKHDFSHQRRLSFEYILFDGFNDTLKHARETLRLLKGIDCRMNLIRFHAIHGVDLNPSPMEKIMIFRDYLNENGVSTTIRKSRGEDILAACGMLAAQKNTIKD